MERFYHNDRDFLYGLDFMVFVTNLSIFKAEPYLLTSR